MKKLGIVLCCIICLCGCGKSKDITYDFEKLGPQLQEFFHDTSLITKEALANKYDVDVSKVEESYILMPKLANNADMLLIVKPKKGYTKEVKKAFDSLFEAFLTQYELYYQEEYQKIENKSYIEKDGYLIYIVSDQSLAVLKTIESGH